MLLKGEKYGGQKGPNITGQNIFIAAASETMPIQKHLWKPKNKYNNRNMLQMKKAAAESRNEYNNRKNTLKTNSF